MQYLKSLAVAIFIFTSSFAFAQAPTNLTTKQQDLWQFFQIQKDTIRQRFEILHSLKHLKKAPTQMEWAIHKQQMKELDGLFARLIPILDLHYSHEQIKLMVKRAKKGQPILDIIKYNLPNLILYWMVESTLWGKEMAYKALSINEVTYAYLEKNYAKALKIADTKLAQNPKDVVSLLYKGLTLADSLKKPRYVLEYTTKALAIKRYFHKAYFYRTKYYLGQGNFKLAKKDINSALAYWGEYPLYLYHSAVIDYNLKNTFMVEFTVGKILRLDNKFADAYALKATLHDDNKRYELAIIDYNKAIELDSTNASYYGRRAGTYQHAGKYRLALNDLTKAIELDKNDSFYYVTRAEIYRLLKQYDLSLRDCNKAIMLNSREFGNFEARAFIYLKIKKYKEALADFEKVLTLNIPQKNRIYTYNNIGHTKYKMGRYAEALKDINQSLSKDAANSYAYKNRALVYIAQGKKALACADLQKAKTLGYTNKYGKEVEKLIAKHCNEK